ncbi:hypothetical protein MUP95_03770 [bacterium]|nr:hypothetical protein [bacterium]
MNKVINPIIASVVLITTIVIFSSCSKKAEEKQAQPNLQIEEIKISDRKGVRVKTQEEIILTIDVYNKGDRQLKYEWSVTGGTIEPVDSTINIASCKYIAPNKPGMHRVTLKILEQDKAGFNLVATKFLDLDIYELPDIQVFSSYTPSGYMGEATACVTRRSTTYAGRQCTQITYRHGSGSDQWAGIYWLDGSGDVAWSKRVDLQGYEKVEFYARGAGIGNEWVEFKVGDNEGSDFVSTGEILLEGNQWRLIEMDLRNRNLSSILPFAWIAPRPENQMVIYFTCPVFKFKYED